METRSKSSFYVGAAFIILGVLFLLNNARIISFDFLFENFWPLLLIAVGSLVIYTSYRKKNTPTGGHTTFADRSEEFNDDFINNSVTFGEYNVVIDSQSFKGGRLTTTFGEMNVDLTRVKLAEGLNILNLNSTFGELNVSLPKDMPVRVTASVVAGDIKITNQKWDGLNKRAVWQSDSYDSASAKLDISSQIVFGEIKVW